MLQLSQLLIQVIQVLDDRAGVLCFCMLSNEQVSMTADNRQDPLDLV